MLSKILPRLQSFRILTVDIDNESPGRKSKENWTLNVTQVLEVSIGVPKNSNTPPVANVIVELRAIAKPVDSEVDPAKFSAKYKIVFSFAKETTADDLNFDMENAGNMKYFIENQSSLVSLVNFKELLVSSGFSSSKIGYFM